MAHTTRERVLPAAMLMFVVLMLPEPACRSSSRACGPCNTAHAAAHVPPMTGGRLDLALFVFIPEKQVCVPSAPCGCSGVSSLAWLTHVARVPATGVDGRACHAVRVA